MALVSFGKYLGFSKIGVITLVCCAKHEVAILPPQSYTDAACVSIVPSSMYVSKMLQCSLEIRTPQEVYVETAPGEGHLCKK